MTSPYCESNVSMSPHDHCGDPLEKGKYSSKKYLNVEPLVDAFEEVVGYQPYSQSYSVSYDPTELLSTPVCDEHFYYSLPQELQQSCRSTVPQTAISALKRWDRSGAGPSTRVIESKTLDQRIGPEENEMNRTGPEEMEMNLFLSSPFTCIGDDLLTSPQTASTVSMPDDSGREPRDTEWQDELNRAVALLEGIKMVDMGEISRQRLRRRQARERAIKASSRNVAPV